MVELGPADAEAAGEDAGARPDPPAWIGRAEGAVGILFALALVFLPADIAREPLAASPSAVAPALRPPGFFTAPAPPRLTDEVGPRGWVIDGAGMPVADVSIEARSDGDPAAAEPITFTSSDAEGAFTAPVIADGTYLLALSGAAIFPAEVRWQLPGPAVRVMVTRRHSIAGIVKHDGSAVGGFQVALSDGSGPATRVVTTDARGEFRFDELVPGLYELWAQGQGRASPVLGVPRFGPGPHARVDIALQPATAIRGRVIEDKAKSGLAAALVLTSTSGATRGRVTTSDADGYFRFEGALPGRFAIEADAAGYVALTDYAVKVEAAQRETEIELRLSKGGVAIGQVVSANGEPVVGAELILSQRGGKGGQSYSAAARAQRALRFAVEANPAVASARARWIHPLAGERLMPANASRHFGAARAGQRPAECERGHCGVDLGKVRGAVVHAAAAGEVIAVVRESRSQAGRFVSLGHPGAIKTAYMHLDEVRVDLEPGQRLRAGESLGTVGRSGMRINNPHLHFAMSQRRGGQYWFIDPEPMLRHAVVLPEPAPLADFAAAPAEDGVETLIATAMVRPRPGAPLSADVGQAAAAVFTSDAEGRFTIGGLRPGSYVARAFHAELAPGVSRPFRISAGRETDGIVVRLTSGVVLYGAVHDARGPVAEARVVAETGQAVYAREVAQAVTDELGNYELAPLSGAIVLRVTAPGFGPAERAVTLSNRGAEVVRRDESFALAAADAQLSGRISDPDGFPLRNARLVIASGASGGGRATTTDENGRFTFAALAEGAYELRISSPGYPSVVARATTGTAAALAVKQGGGARLLVRDAHTRAAMPGVGVKAIGPGGARREVTADSDGQAELVPIMPGKWQLEVRVPGYVRARKLIEVAAGRGPRAITVDSVVVELARGATIAGVIRDENGDRVAGAKVESGGVSTATDQHGRFRLVDVPTGKVTIAARRGQDSGELALELAPGDEFLTLEILFGVKSD